MPKWLIAFTCLLALLTVIYFFLPKPQPSPSQSQTAPLPTPTIQPNGPLNLTTQPVVNITITDDGYFPKEIIINKDTQVIWTNTGEMKHNAMLNHDESEAPHDVVDAHDETKFEGPLLAKGESYSFTFSASGDYPYHCAPHPWMQGHIQVTE